MTKKNIIKGYSKASNVFREWYADVLNYIEWQNVYPTYEIQANNNVKNNIENHNNASRILK